MAATTSVVEVGGVALEVHEFGAGPEVVYLHGEDGLLFNGPLLGLLAYDLHVTAPVLPGWSRDVARAVHLDGIDDLAHVVLDLLDTFASPPVVVGASIGAWVALEAAVRDPRSMRALVLVSPVGIKVRGRTDRDYLDLFAAPDEEITAAFYFGSPPVDRASMNTIELQELARAQEAVARYAWKPWFHNPKLRGRLSRFRSPVHVIYGAEDRFVYDADEFYGAFSESFASPPAVTRLADGAHRIDEEHPRALSRIIANVAHDGASMNPGGR